MAILSLALLFRRRENSSFGPRPSFYESIMKIKRATKTKTQRPSAFLYSLCSKKFTITAPEQREKSDYRFMTRWRRRRWKLNFFNSRCARAGSKMKFPPPATCQCKYNGERVQPRAAENRFHQANDPVFDTRSSLFG
jgi:hypothetical protein